MSKYLSPVVVAAVYVSLTFLAASGSHAQEKSVKPGINKAFKNPDVKEFLKKFERESREVANLSDEIVAACKIKPGMSIADVGAGTGLFTRKFAAKTGAKGQVYAVDIARPFLTYIEKTCTKAKLNNVKTVLCDQFSTKLPKNSVDLVFICDAYHHFEFPQRTLESIHDALKPGGRIALIDFERIKGKTSDWIFNHVRAGKEVFIGEIVAAGFKVVGEEKLLKENYFVFLQKVPRPTTKKSASNNSASPHPHQRPAQSFQRGNQKLPAKWKASPAFVATYKLPFTSRFTNLLCLLSIVY